MQTLRYTAPTDAVWHHFVFGNVPGHQLDWIWRPSPDPQAPTSQHVQHLQHLVQLFDVTDPAVSTLTLGNLSTGDSRHRAGHGALALLMHFRLPGCRDHSGRPNPPLVHALVAVDREITADALVEAANELVRNTVGNLAPPNRPIDLWYARYLDATTVSPAAASEIWRSYTAGFDRLPTLAPGTGQNTWSVPEDEAMPPLVDLISDVSPDTELAMMAGLAEVLFHTRARWSAITTAQGGQGARDQGTLIRFSPAEFAQGASPKRRLSRLPPEPARLAAQFLPIREDAQDAGVEDGPEPPRQAWEEPSGPLQAVRVELASIAPSPPHDITPTEPQAVSYPTPVPLEGETPMPLASVERTLPPVANLPEAWPRTPRTPQTERTLPPRNTPVTPPVPRRITQVEPPPPPEAPWWRLPAIVVVSTFFLVFALAFLANRFGLIGPSPAPTREPTPTPVAAPTPPAPTPPTPTPPTPAPVPATPTPSPTPVTSTHPTTSHTHTTTAPVASTHTTTAPVAPAAPVAAATARAHVTVADDMAQRCRVSGPSPATTATALRGPTALASGSYVLSCTTTTSPRAPVEMYTASLEADQTYALACVGDQCRLRKAK